VAALIVACGQVPEEIGVGGRAVCEVWWAGPGLARPEHVALLDQPEVGRHDRLRRPEDRDRFVVGVALARLVLGRRLGVPAGDVRLDRSCRWCGEPHGKPRVIGGAGLELSVSHSGDRVAVAVSSDHAIGVDVELIDAGVDLAGLIDQVLAPSEADALAAGPSEHRRAGLFRYWSRKEAVVKATGDGLRVPLVDLAVSAPSEPPELRRWRDRPDMSARVRLVDLAPGRGYVASLASLDATALEVIERDGSELLNTDQGPEYR
jgi:4'-phosphopantetheinyl transferase